MTTLSHSMSDQLAAIGACAYAARNAVVAGMNEAALGNLDTVIASVQEALASLAHDQDIAETRAAKQQSSQSGEK